MIAQSEKLRVPRGMVSPVHYDQANVGNYTKKYSLPLIFKFYLNGDTSVLESFPVVLFQWKGFSMPSVLTHLSRSKLSKKLLIAVERSEMTFISIHIITNNNSCHDDKSAQVLNTRILSPTDQKCADSSTYWQLLYYRPPGKFRSF